MNRLLVFSILFLSLTATAQNAARYDSLTAAYERAGYHGVILVAKGDQVLYQKGYGYANFTEKIPHKPGTLFKTESVGKMFTSTAILQLVEQGKLRLNQTIKEVLPALQAKNADKITVDQLLKHTSGLQSPWDHPQWTFKKRHSRQELERIITETPLAFETPGKEMYYSNSGYQILGWMIEAVTGKPFDKYFQTQFFTPLKMVATRELNDTIMPLKTGAQPYRIVSSKRFISMSETVGPEASPAGGWISTAADLHKFAAALNSGKLLKPSSLQTMRTANGAAPADSSHRFYAYGLETYKNSLVPGYSFFGHNGGGAGFSVDVFTEPSTGYTVVSCTNLYQNSRPIMANYFRVALNEPLKPVEKAATVRLYDLIDSIGMTAFQQRDSVLFAQLNIDPHPGVFAQLGEAMTEVGDHDLSAQWMELGLKRHPEQGMLFFINGELLLKAGKKGKAKEMFLQAKALGEKHNDGRVLAAADGKLKEMI